MMLEPNSDIKDHYSIEINEISNMEMAKFLCQEMQKRELQRITKCLMGHNFQDHGRTSKPLKEHRPKTSELKMEH